MRYTSYIYSLHFSYEVKYVFISQPCNLARTTPSKEGLMLDYKTNTDNKRRGPLCI